MSINFAIKDILHHRNQTKKYLRSSESIIILNVIYLFLLESLGLTTRGDMIEVYNDTIVGIFSQYNQFLTLLIFVFAILLIINNNHAIIQHRKKDIATMKALGSLPGHIMGFYLTEILILIAFSFVVGIIVGMIGFFIIFIILELFIPTLIWTTNFEQIILLGFLMFIFTFLLNLWEIHRLCIKSFDESKSGKINEKINARLSQRTRVFLRKKTLSMKIAIKNLLRKKHDVRQKSIIISISAATIITGIVGVLILNNSSQEFISNAQPENRIIIAHNDIIESYTEAYLRFSNRNVEELVLNDYIQEKYELNTFNDTIFDFFTNNDIETIDSDTTSNLFLEKRAFTLYNISERESWVITNAHTINETQYTRIGTSNRSRIVCLQGIESNQQFTHYTHNGNPLDKYRKAIIGDTLGADIFEYPLNQSLKLYNFDQDIEYVYHISTVVIDTFNNGNSLYLPLNDVHKFINQNDFYNILVVDLKEIESFGEFENKDNLLSELNILIQTSLGDDFQAFELDEIFQKNQESLFPVMILTLSLSLIITVFVIYTMQQYQMGRIQEDEEEIAIFKAIGLESSTLRKSLMIENIAIVLFSFVVGFIISAAFLLFFLMDELALPSIFVPLGVSVFSFIIILILLNSSTKRVLKIHYTSEELFMKNI